MDKKEYEQVKKELIADLRQEIFRFISGVGKEVIIEELKKIDVPDYLAKRMDTLFEQKFEPIVKNAINLSVQKVSKKINRQLQSVISLKTSTICEIQSEIRSIPTETEEEILKELSEEFPELYIDYHEKKTKAKGELLLTPRQNPSDFSEG